MTERKNLPAAIAAQSVAVLSEQRGSLVGRGLAAFQEKNNRELVRNSQDERYRQARVVFNRIIQRKLETKWKWNRNSDYLSVFKVFQQLANENYGKAYYPLSILYCIKQDIGDGQNRAKHFFRLAIDWCLANQDNQDMELWCDLGEMYLLFHHSIYLSYQCGLEDVIEEYIEEDEERCEEAVKWFRLAADQGHADSQKNLGDMYEYGQYFPYDDEEAEKWYRLAAEQGNATAQNHLADLLVDHEQEQAEYWFRKAAEQDNYGYDQQKLGSKYKAGCGVSQDDVEAVFWFRKSAELGCVEGQLELGGMYFEGRGIEQNYEQATYWFLNAHEQVTSADVDAGNQQSRDRAIPASPYRSTDAS